MKKLLIVLALLGSLFAETELAEPKPDFANPRKLILPIKSGEPEEIHHVLSTANNLLKFYGPDNITIRIVAYYHGIKSVLKSSKEFAVRVEALQQYNVIFTACGNTMRTKKIDKSELLDDVEVVTAGVAEMIERSLSGWTYIKP